MKSLDRAIASFVRAIIVNSFTVRIDKALIDRGLSHLARARADIVR